MFLRCGNAGKESRRALATIWQLAGATVSVPESGFFGARSIRPGNHSGVAGHRAYVNERSESIKQTGCPSRAGPRRLRWKTPAKGDEQFPRTLQANLSTQQYPDNAPFLPQKPDPRFCIGVDMQVRLADVSVLNRDLLVTNHDGHFSLFATCEGEMVGVR